MMITVLKLHRPDIKILISKDMFDVTNGRSRMYLPGKEWNHTKNNLIIGLSILWHAPFEIAGGCASSDLLNILNFPKFSYVNLVFGTEIFYT